MIELAFTIAYAGLFVIWAVCIIVEVMHQRNNKHDVSYGHYEAIQDLYGTEAADNYLSRHGN